MVGIHLPEIVIWREGFVEEIVGFPGEFDHQVDALTQYLDFMESDPVIPPPRKRATGVVVHALPFSELRRRF
jgi:hypothetical protein